MTIPYDMETNESLDPSTYSLGILFGIIWILAKQWRKPMDHEG